MGGGGWMFPAVPGGEAAAREEPEAISLIFQPLHLKQKQEHGSG